MTRILQVVLPSPDRRLCGNGYLGKFARARVVKAHRMAAARAPYALPDGVSAASFLLAADPFFPADSRVRVDVTVRRDPLWAARRLDDDNLWRGLKPYLDGLQDAGLVANDRQFCMGTVTWETAQPYRGGVVLTLTEQGG